MVGLLRKLMEHNLTSKQVISPRIVYHLYYNSVSNSDGEFELQPSDYNLVVSKMEYMGLMSAC